MERRWISPVIAVHRFVRWLYVMLLRGGFRAQSRLSTIDQAKMFYRYTLLDAGECVSSYR